MKKQTNSLTNLFDALDRVPEDRKENALMAAVEYLDTIKQMRSAGANTAEIEKAGDRILAKYQI